jgi:hypothetical protein
MAGQSWVRTGSLVLLLCSQGCGARDFGAGVTDEELPECAWPEQFVDSSGDPVDCRASRLFLTCGDRLETASAGCLTNTVRGCPDPSAESGIMTACSSRWRSWCERDEYALECTTLDDSGPFAGPPLVRGCSVLWRAPGFSAYCCRCEP